MNGIGFSSVNLKNNMTDSSFTAVTPKKNRRLIALLHHIQNPVSVDAVR